MIDCLTRRIGVISPRIGLRAIFMLFPALVVAGCMDLETIVRVNPDGSGTITERVVMSNEIIDMMSEMAPEGQPAEFFNEEDLRNQAMNYGAGVSYVSAEGVQTEFGQGYIAHYAFNDINRIRVGQDPGKKMPGSGAMESGVSDDEFTTFSMRPGYPSELVIHWPVDKEQSGSAAPDTAQNEDFPSGEAEPEPSPEQQEAAMEMMKMAFRDMRMAMHVEVDGQILDTNATHLDGNRITLVEIAFAEFLESEEALQTLAANKDQSVADIKELMRLIPGLRMEIEPEVGVLFQ